MFCKLKKKYKDLRIRLKILIFYECVKKSL